MSEPTAVIDPTAIANLRALGTDGSDDFLREIVGIFIADTPARIAELDAGFAGGHPDQYTRAAHSIKGSASNVGALHLQQAAARLEAQARVGGPAGTEGLLAAVKAEYARAAAALQGLTGGTA